MGFSSLSTIATKPLPTPTRELWLKNIDDNAEAVKKIMVSHTGSEEAAAKQFNYWRGLNLLGIELFGYANGEEWMTTHLLFKKKCNQQMSQQVAKRFYTENFPESFLEFPESSLLKISDDRSCNEASWREIGIRWSKNT
ncbi:hypothetical protein Scep_024864 [Stephania cephalantha]|uniref:Uncharacterized protein n=1 Tax=Stephania cephalantha TaxID=152367 RepID=A0AAP0EY26_9MAGN